MVGSLWELAFGGAYGAFILAVALLAAIPYGLWQAWTWAWRRRPGGSHGND